MLIPAAFRVEHRPALLQLIREHPLATLISTGPDGPIADHVPLLYIEDSAGLSLQGHINRANPLWQTSAPVLAIFHGPNAYISPRWYPANAQDRRAVPTWNYTVVHATATLVAHDNPTWLRHMLNAQATAGEPPGTAPWQLHDADPAYIERLLPAIVGIELRITEIVGQFKRHQNHPEENRRGVIAGLRERGLAEGVAVAWAMEGDLG